LKGGGYLGDLGMMEDNIKTDLKGKGFKGVDWIHLPQNRMCEH
jgi:hypothetical protein